MKRTYNDSSKIDPYAYRANSSNSVSSRTRSATTATSSTATKALTTATASTSTKISASTRLSSTGETPASTKTSTAAKALTPSQWVVDYPLEMYFGIFSLYAYTPDFHKAAQVCKTWRAVILNNSFGSIILKREGIEKDKPEDSWIKTYQVWLKTQTFILLDCSSSMPIESKEAVHQLVISKAKEVFSKEERVKKEVNLGVFAEKYAIKQFTSELKLTDFLTNIDNNLLKLNFDRTGSEILPLFRDVKTKIRSNNETLKAVIHIITDCVIYYPFKIADSFDRLLSLKEKNLSIIIHQVEIQDPSIQVIEFVDQIKKLEESTRDGAINHLFITQIKNT